MKKCMIMLGILLILVSSFSEAKNFILYTNNNNIFKNNIEIYNHNNDIFATYTLYGNLNDLWINVSDVKILHPKHKNGYGCSVVGWPYTKVGCGFTIFLPVINGGEYNIYAKVGNKNSYSSEYMGGVIISLINNDNISIRSISEYHDAWVGSAKITLHGIFGSGKTSSYNVWRGGTIYIRNGRIVVGSNSYYIGQYKLGITFSSCYYNGNQRPFIPTYVHIKIKPSKVIVL